MNADRTIEHDWHPGHVPENVAVDSGAYLETSYSFHLFRSRRPDAVRIGRGASLYLGVMFDLGPEATVSIGAFSLIHGTRFIADSSITIGSHCLISWNTVLLGSRRAPPDQTGRRRTLTALPHTADRRLPALPPQAGIQIGDGVWIGFDACVLPGVTIGHGAVVGARSVVHEDVPPFCIVAGNPARRIRQLDAAESEQAIQAAMAAYTPAPSAP